MKLGQIAFMLLVVNFVYSQPNDKRQGWVVFQLLDSTSYQPVVNAHIVFPRSRQGTISNEQGNFWIPIQILDTLIISAIGFQRQQYVFNGDWGAKNESQLILLKPDSYCIDSVFIVRHKSYYNFIKDASTRDIPLTKEEQRLENLTQNINDVETDSLIMPEQSPYEVPYLKLVSATWYFGEDWYSKQQKKISRKIKKANRMEPIYAIVSAAGIERLIGLKGSEAIDFLVFCDFSSRFLESSTEYEVAKAVLDKFEEYKRTIPSISY